MNFFKLKKPVGLLCLFMVLLALIVGCGGGGGGGSGGNEIPTPPVTKGTLKIVNSTGQSIDHAFLSPASTTSWGADQLSSSITNGSSRDIVNTPAGSYDVKVVLADGSIKYEYGEIVLAGATTTCIIPPPIVVPPPVLTGVINIANSTGQAINNAYISTASSSTWGADQLSSSISNGSSLDIVNILAGQYDVKVVLADGTIKYQYGVSVVAGVTTTVTFNTPPPTTGAIKVANSTGQTINNLYISPASSNTWGPDQLGTSTIANAANFTITNIPPGSYDVKVVLADGTPKYEYVVSVVAGVTATVTFIPSPITTGSIKIANNTGLTINSAYISPASSTVWGVNQLSSSISTGSSRDITNIPAGSYDVKVILSDLSVQYRYGVSVVAGSINTVTFTPVITTGKIQINNLSGQTIYNLYVSPASSSAWGPDQLESSTIANGSSFTLTNVPPGSYDIKAVTANGSVAYYYGASVVAGSTFTLSITPPSPPPTGSLKINNYTGQTIYNVYLSPDNSTTWGPDQLGASTILYGYSFTLTNILPGAYDFKAVLADGSYRVLSNFTISSGSTFTVNVNP